MFPMWYPCAASENMTTSNAYIELASDRDVEMLGRMDLTVVRCRAIALRLPSLSWRLESVKVFWGFEGG